MDYLAIVSLGLNALILAVVLLRRSPGIDKETAAAATADMDDLYAAVVLARKRAFGPFRKVELDDKRKARELSAFARGGFSFEIGKRVFAMTLEEAEEVLDAGRHF